MMFVYRNCIIERVGDKWYDQDSRKWSFSQAHPRVRITWHHHPLDAYFARLRERVVAAGKEGIYVAVMFFDGWGLHLPSASVDTGPLL
jgi:hypothetical protein